MLAALGLCAAVSACTSGEGQQIHDAIVVGPDGQRTAVRLPARLDRAGLVPDRACRYQVLAHVAVAPALVGQDLVLVLPSLSARARASADGAQLGTVRGGATDGYRQRPPLAWSVPADLTRDGSLDVTIDVEHTWTQSAWWTTAPELVLASSGLGTGTWVERYNLALATAALVVIVSIGLVMAWIYLIDRSRITSGYFAIQALLAATYPAQVLGLLIPLGRLEVPVMGTGLVVAVTVALHYTSAFFSLPPPSRWWPRAALAAMAVMWVLSDLFISTTIAAYVIVGYLTVALGALFVTIVRLIRARGGREPWLYLLPWLSLALAAPPDFLSWLGLAEPLGGARAALIAFVLFPLLLELLLNQQQVGTLHRANVQLAGQVSKLELHRVEIEQLNNELRRQISDRGGQIHAALLLARGRGGTAPVLAAGEVVQGRYRVERPLGAGGMGTVYEVTRLVDGRRLALKLAREVNGEALARMAREAQTASTVTNPHVVAMLDVDVASAGFLYLVMELVEGEPLSHMRERYGDQAWALDVLAQLADGLAALHRGGVIHRDLKPSNVLLARDEAGALRIKITDFGISVPEQEGADAIARRDTELAGGGEGAANTESAAVGTPPPAPGATRELYGKVRVVVPGETTAATQPSPAPPPPPAGAPGQRPGPLPHGKRGEARGSASDSLTRTGFLPGTPAYMAPELAQGRHRLVLAADIFAFGVIARELLVGKRPFPEPVVLALLEGRPTPAPPPIAEHWPGVPGELGRLLDACLAFVPSARPTASVLLAALEAHQPARVPGEISGPDETDASGARRL